MEKGNEDKGMDALGGKSSIGVQGDKCSSLGL
jgi:hypothetical protein